MTADTYRALALALEGVEEKAHMGHPDFRVNGRIFATLLDQRRATIMLTPEEQAAVMDEAPAVFTPAPGAWGRQGATSVALPAAREPEVRGALLLAWERIRLMPPPRRRSPARRTR